MRTANRPEIDLFARRAARATSYIGVMTALTPDQLELLERAAAADPMWGGSRALARVRRDVELLMAMQAIEQDEGGSYQITELGMRVL